MLGLFAAVGSFLKAKQFYFMHFVQLFCYSGLVTCQYTLVNISYFCFKCQYSQLQMYLASVTIDVCLAFSMLEAESFPTNLENSQSCLSLFLPFNVIIKMFRGLIFSQI